MVKPLPPAVYSTLDGEASEYISGVDNQVDKSAAAMTAVARKASGPHKPRRAFNKMYGNHSSRSQKAEFSVAPTEFHVQGYVPQVQRLGFKVAHCLPLTKPPPTQDFRLPQYDGADDMAATQIHSQNQEDPARINNREIGSQKNNKDDSRDPAKNPVTTFQTYQQDLPRDHGRQVEQFFTKLADEERQEIMAAAAEEGNG